MKALCIYDQPHAEWLGVVGNLLGTKFDYNSFDFLDSYTTSGVVKFGGITGTLGGDSYDGTYGIMRNTDAGGYLYQEVIIASSNILYSRLRAGGNWQTWRKYNSV